MRSIFDQYDAHENRLTHALGCCLDRDRHLLQGFVRWTTGKHKLPPGQLTIVEQQVPGAPVVAGNGEESGLPDLWVHNEDTWSLIVESKIAAKISAGQLHRHRKTAQRNGFTDITLIVIAPRIPSRRLGGVAYFTWPQVYVWMRRQARKSEWAGCMAEYMEIAEARMTADGYLGDEPLTEFDGIPFGPDHPYTYREAKRALKLAFDELRKRPDLKKFGMDPACAGRPAITGRDDVAVWDFLPLKAAKDKASFTSCPHLTLSIQMQRIVIIVTLPNAVPALMRRNLTSLGIDGFTALVGQVEKGVSKIIRPIGKAYPFVEAAQRHYPSQKSPAVVDARVDFDLRTAVGNSKTPVKKQPQWLEAVFEALTAKRSNLQVAIGAALPYGDKHMHSRDILDVIAGVWLGCKPWLDTILRQS